MKFIDGPTGRGLTGDGIPYHLRDNTGPLGRCDSCGRKTWAPAVGSPCGMPSPTGGVCRGTFRSITLDPASHPGAGVTEPTEASLRGGDGIVPAAHPTPDEEARARDISGFLAFVAEARCARLTHRRDGELTEHGIDHLITRYLAERPRSS